MKSKRNFSGRLSASTSRGRSESGPSITGDTGAKAIVLKKTGACVFTDDQQEILDECLSLQSGRARGNRVKCIKERYGAHQSLDPLVRYLADPARQR